MSIDRSDERLVLPPEAKRAFRRFSALSSRYPAVNIFDEMRKIMVRRTREHTLTDALLRPELFTEIMNHTRGSLAVLISYCATLAEAEYEQPSSVGLKNTASAIESGNPYDVSYMRHLLLFGRAMQNVETLLSQSGAHEALREADSAVSLYNRMSPTHASGGESTSAHTLTRGTGVGLGIMTALPEAVENRWREQFGERIPIDEYRKSVRFAALNPFLSVWKTQKAERVNLFEDRLYAPEARAIQGKIGRPVIDPKQVRLVCADDDTWVLIPGEGILQEMEAIPQPDSLYDARGKCPADSAFIIDDDFISFLKGESQRPETVLVKTFRRVLGDVMSIRSWSDS